MVSRMNKRGILPVAVLIVLVASTLAIMGSLGVNTQVFSKATSSITGSGEYIERPIFKYQKCEACGSYERSAFEGLATDGEWVEKPTSTDKYDVVIKWENSIWQSQRYVEYYICNQRYTGNERACRVFSKVVKLEYKATEFKIENIEPHEEVWVQFQKQGVWGRKGVEGGNYQIGFKPYCLREYNVFGGSSAPINPNSCDVGATSHGWEDSIVYSDSDSVRDLISNNVNERVLQPEEVRWYLSGHVSSAAPSFALDYKGKEAWCRPTGQSAKIYQINKVQTKSGTYKIASEDYSDELGNEKCCPGQTLGDKVCSDDFEWEKVQGSECSLFKSCGSPNWVPYSENKVVKYSCVDGYCEKEVDEVDCASNFDCKDESKVCDLNGFKCVNANVNLDGQRIETVADNKRDCESKGYKWVTEKTNKPSLVYKMTFGALGDKEIIVTEYCNYGDKINWWKVFWVAFFVSLVVGLIFFREVLFEAALKIWDFIMVIIGGWSPFKFG